MKERMRRQRIRPVRLVCICLAAGAMLCGCSRQETTKTISLPEVKQQEKGIPGIIINNIREYVYDGHSEDHLQLSFGERGADAVYLLRYGEKGYTYRKIDINTKKTINETFVDERTLFNIQIAPGGRYFSYEAETKANAPELVLFLAEEGRSVVLRKWTECLQGFSYVWSDDGTKLFSWQDGEDYAFLPDNDWSVTCYDMESLQEDDEGRLSIEKTVIQMKGGGYAWRHVLPNADGSKVYVRVEYETFSDSKKGESMQRNAEREKMMQENNVNKEDWGNEGEKKAAENWLLLPDSHEKKKVEEYAKEPVCPVKYTTKGLYYQSEDGKLFLAENIEEKPSVTELFSATNPEICICSEGDHLFFIEWTDDMQTLQLSGVRMDGAKPTAKQVLYKEKCESAAYSVTADDSAVILKVHEYLGEDKYAFKITKLGY